MQNLFTPVEVIRKRPLCYSTQELLRFNEDCLFQITQPRVPSLADERKKVIHWLRSLPIAHRQQAAVLHSPELVALCRRLYQDCERSLEPLRYRFELSGGQFRVHRQRYYKQSRERQKALLEEVRLISQGQLFQALTLVESALTDPEALFERFEQVLGGVLLDGSNFNEEELKSGRVRFQNEAIGSEPKTLGVWIAQLLLKQILLTFTVGSANMEQICKDNKQQQQEYSKLWRDMPADDRLQLVKKGFSRPKEDLMEEYRNSVGVIFQELPILYMNQTIEEAIQEYTEIHSKDIFSRLLFSTLEQSLNLYEIFKIELTMEIEAYLAAQKTGTMKKQKKKKKKNIDRIDRIPATTIINQRTEQRIIQPPQKAENIIILNEQKVEAGGENQTLSQIQHQLTEIAIDSAIRQQSQQLSKQPQPEILQPPQKPTQNILDEFIRRLRQKNRDKYRKIILNRLTVIFGQLSLVCRPFGSYAVHLSLPDSDLDLQVDSSLLGYFYLDFLSQRNQVVAALDFLKKMLEPQPWISGFELFHNARIPLLTFKADAGIHFPNPTNLKTKLRLNGKAIPNGEATIQVDLSIQPYANMTELPHNGLQATETIREWIQTMPVLEKLVLGLKSVIRRASLHKSYEGGLSSYCLVLLTVAFLKSTSNQQQNSDAVFESLVAFLRKFNQQRLVVDIGHQEMIREGQGEIPVLVSPWDGRNLVERVFRFREILDALEQWQQALQK